MRRSGRILTFTFMAFMLAAGVTACSANHNTNTSTGAATTAAPTTDRTDTGTVFSQPYPVAPNFSLTDQFGQQVSLSQFKGKVVFLTFNDDQCTTICPLTTQALLEMLNLLGPNAEQVQLIGINANPTATSVQDVARFSRDHGLMDKWHFLTGSKSQLEAVWNAYHVGVDIANGQIDHTPADFIIDSAGNERELFLTSPLYSDVGRQAEMWARQVASLLPGQPALATQLPAQSVNSNLSINSSITLPSIVSGDAGVTIGPDKPRLLAFFASWAPNISSSLLDLNAYQAEAENNSGVPGVVAIDVASVEPTAAGAPNLISGLSSPLSYPVAVDESGSVADACKVQDIPWLVLVNNGHILWSYDGWLNHQALLAAVKSALNP